MKKEVKKMMVDTLFSILFKVKESKACRNFVGTSASQWVIVAPSPRPNHKPPADFVHYVQLSPVNFNRNSSREL